MNAERKTEPPYFANDLHALDTGCFLGFMLARGIGVQPDMDDEGNYRPRCQVTLESPDGEIRYVWITIESQDYMTD